MKLLYVFACLLPILFPTLAGAECLKSNVEGQIAEGLLTIGYAHDAAGRPERPYILRPASSACLDADDPDEAVERTRTIHVFPADRKVETAFRRLVGKSVEVRGNPFSAHTAHHHAPIVMEVSEIKPAAR